MPDVRRNPEKMLRKDQRSVRDTREELLEEIRSSDVQPLVKKATVTALAATGIAPATITMKKSEVRSTKYEVRSMSRRR